jgi:hypothetical protein
LDSFNVTELRQLGRLLLPLEKISDVPDRHPYISLVRQKCSVRPSSARKAKAS